MINKICLHICKHVYKNIFYYVYVITDNKINIFIFLILFFLFSYLNKIETNNNPLNLMILFPN